MDYPIEIGTTSNTRPGRTCPWNQTTSPPRSRSSSSTRSQNFSRPHDRALPLRDYIPPTPIAPPTSRRTIAVPSTPSTPTLPRRPKPKTYFLTGASRGLGLECVRQLCSNPFNTIIAGVRSTTSSSISTLKALNEQNKNIHIIECNVSDPISLSALEFRVAEILSISGANLDYIFNLAGMSMNNNNSFSSSDTFLTLDPTVFQAQMQANVLGPAKIIQSLRRYLARGAVVMNLSSGLGGLPRSCTYSISMAALQRLTVHAARDLKPMGVRVVCMEPGAKGGGEVTVRVEGMLRVVGGLGERDSGGWFRWDGGSMMW